MQTFCHRGTNETINSPPVGYPSFKEVAFVLIIFGAVGVATGTCRQCFLSLQILKKMGVCFVFARYATLLGQWYFSIRTHRASQE